jgi:sulfide:quinone oxidoreductase
MTFRDQRDAPLLRRALDHAWAQERHRVVFAAPAGVTWTLPLYELALQAAAEADERGIPAEIAIATPERRPLEVFGPGPSGHVAGLLADRDVRFFGRMQPSMVRHEGLELLYEGLLPAEAVIAVPRLAGQRISGVPADWNGFTLTDDLGRVEGAPDVYAAGDMTRYPVKQGGLAVQQAEVVARAVAESLGADLEPEPMQRILRARLVGGDAPLYLRAPLDTAGRAVVDGEALPESAEPPWWPGAKVFGRHLAPYLAERLARAA